MPDTHFTPNLTDLLNSNATAYEYFYALTPQTQTLLRCRDIRNFEELKQAAADIDINRRPRTF